MVVVEIFSLVYDDESASEKYRWRATITARATDIEIDGEGNIVNYGELNVLDPRTGEYLRGTDDPERWARNLPQALGGERMLVSVVHDSDSEEPLPVTLNDEE